MRPRQATARRSTLRQDARRSCTISASSSRPRAIIARRSRVSTRRWPSSPATPPRTSIAAWRWNDSGDADEAIAAFARTTVLDPGHYDAHRALGFLWLAQGERGRALDHFARTYELRRGEDRAGHRTPVARLCKSRQAAARCGAIPLPRRAPRREAKRFELLARSYDEVASELPAGIVRLIAAPARSARRGLQHRNPCLGRTGDRRPGASIPRSMRARSSHMMQDQAGAARSTTC